MLSEFPPMNGIYGKRLVYTYITMHHLSIIFSFFILPMILICQ